MYIFKLDSNIAYCVCVICPGLFYVLLLTFAAFFVCAPADISTSPHQPFSYLEKNRSKIHHKRSLSRIHQILLNWKQSHMCIVQTLETHLLL